MAEKFSNNKDLLLSKEGDLVFNVIDDNVYEISLIKGVKEVEQNIHHRLKTNLMELFLHERFGNSLLQIIGERNTEETAELGKGYLRETILYKNEMIQNEDLSIDASPIDRSKLLYIIKVRNGPFASIDIVLEVDLKEGIRRVV